MAKEVVLRHLMSWFAGSWDTKMLGDVWCNEGRKSKTRWIVKYRDCSERIR